VRICGFTCALKNGTTIYHAEDTGDGGYLFTPGFAPPELVSSNPYTKAAYEQDIFSLGCILYNLILRRPLYDTLEDLMRMSFTPRINSDCTDELVHDLLLKMLARDPSERPSIEKVLEDPYLVGGPQYLDELT
jgi:serine/threonine protein kinase